MKHKFYYLAFAVVVAIVLLALYSYGLFAGVERFFQDRLFSDKPINQDIAIIVIDDTSIGEVGQWPWPRSVFSELINHLEPLGVKALGIDVVFAEPSRDGLEDDNSLAGSLMTVSFPVVMPIEGIDVQVKNDRMIANQTVKTRADFTQGPQVSIGHVNLITEQDGVVRTVPTHVGVDDKTWVPGFAFALANKAGIPIPQKPEIKRIVYAGSPQTFPQYSFVDVLNGKHDAELKNKILIVGATASDLHDTKTTPVSFGVDMAGVEIQANIVNMEILGLRLDEASGSKAILFLFIIALLAALPFLIFSRTILIILSNIVLGIIVLVVTIIYFDRGIILPIVYSQATWILTAAALFGYRYSSTDKERRQIKEVFSKYVSSEVLNHIMQDPTKVKLGGQEKQVTVFFSDIRGFTTISEKLSPTELVRVLNKYFTVMTGLVLENGGVVDKYIGDAIMAFWGAPLDDDDRADHALQTSIAMLKALKVLNKELKEAGDPEINIGIGLFSGPAVVGNVGSDQRFDYTAMGDTVNAASRLESSNKQYETQILISQSTVDLLKLKYPLKFVDSATVKGRAEPIKIYTLDLE